MTKARLAKDSIKNVHILEADMADNTSLTTAAAAMSPITNGALDYLIINGAYINTEINDITPSQFQGKEDLLRKEMIASLDVNVLGVMYSINAFLPLIRKGEAKKIIAISSGLADSTSARYGTTSAIIYSAMKAAMNMVVAKYAGEVRSEGIMLLALCPGMVDTKETPSMLPCLLLIDRRMY